MTEPPHLLALERPQTATPLLSIANRMSTLSGRSRLAILGEFLRLRYGKGKILLSEYWGMRLFDRALYHQADLSRFVGFHAAQSIWLRCNFQLDVFGLANHKLTFDHLFAAHGFPVLPTIAMYREAVGQDTPFLLRDRAAVQAFLTNPNHFPLFGKPVSGHQSLGALSLDHYDTQRRCLVTTTGMPLTVDNYVNSIQPCAGSGYLFQRRIIPHAQVRALCGDRLATVRVLTIGNKILRACWKIPAGLNMADNFWRAGNVLAAIDINTGLITHAIQGDGQMFAPITHHPDSNILLVGTQVPNWHHITRLAEEASRVIPEIPLAGWDIAPVDDGAVLVEMNETPDFRLHQMADRRGILDDELLAFLALRDAERQAWFKTVKAHRSGN